METPNAATAAQSDTGRNRVWSALLEYALKNPFLVLWNVALILGGLISFSHFATIRYFPDLDFKTASSFLLGVALLGMVMILILAFTLVIPSYLIHTDVWKPYLLSSGGAVAQAGAGRVNRGLLRPFIAISLLHGLTAFSFWLFVASFFIDDASSAYRQKLRYASGMALLLWVAVQMRVIMRWNRVASHSSGSGGQPRLDRKELRRSVTIWMIIYPGILILNILSAAKLNADDMAGHLLVAVFAVAFIMANIGLAATDFTAVRSYWKIPAVAAFLLVFYLSIPSNPVNITRSVFVSLAIGDLEGSRLVVKRPTCDAINLIVPGACTVGGEHLGCVRPSILANRIGNEYLLVFKNPTHSGAQDASAHARAANRDIRMPIPKTEVLVWAASDADGSLTPACGAAAGKDWQPGERAVPEPAVGRH